MGTFCHLGRLVMCRDGMISDGMVCDGMLRDWDVL